MTMLLESGTMLGVLCLFFSIQISHQAIDLDMMPDTFDDQYIGCADRMEAEMAKILKQELKYKKFGEMWKRASRKWEEKRSNFPRPIDDNYGTALVLYTMEYPYPIYRELNGNISIVGQCRGYYMENFHFKALHFYLTRALQVLRRGCTKSQVYRGTKIGAVNVAKKMRFDRFSSSSKNKDIALGFGTNPFFSILTCFGVSIENFSVSKREEEVLIPVGETFKLGCKIGTTYELESTGELCSYFNCAYLGGEKRKNPVCKSGQQGLRSILQAVPKKRRESA